MNFKFSNLLGAAYRGGNLLLHGNELLTPVGNRVSQVDLAASTSVTLPFENATQIRTLCLSPNGQLLVSIDDTGRALLVNKQRRAVLHHFSFKGPVAAAKFSPDGEYIACAVGRILQVWGTPSMQKSMTPMQLHRTYGSCHGDITTLDWSADSQWLAVGSKDLTARVFSLNPIEGYRPPTLAGHRDTLVGVFFAGDKAASQAVVDGKEPPALYTVSKDGALFSWTFRRQQRADSGAGGDAEAGSVAQIDSEQSHLFSGGDWALLEKQFFMQRGARLSATDYHKPTGMLVVAFTNGIFDMYELPAFDNVHTLSVSRERITAVAFNGGGDWVALACAKLGQLLVWEWRSETYVLKQQGHYHDVACAAFSPDAAYIATGADDSKVKVWTLQSGFCFVTFSDHAAPVTAVTWLPSGHAVVSASLDGTVRAFDLVRYRNFRTFTSPTPAQFACLAVDPSGEIVCAGSLDTFQIFVWSLKTGRLLDVLAAHQGPVVGLAFSPRQPLLASASWDKSVRTWDVFDNKGSIESLDHGHDVLAVAFRPDGKQLAAATLDGQITFWDPLEGVPQGSIEGRRDFAGGRLMGDRRSAGNQTSGQCFTSLAYSADGSFLLAGGRSKYVCMYDVAEKVMLRRFQVSRNRALDGVLDLLNSRAITDAGPADLINDDASDDDLELLPTGGDPAADDSLPGTGGRRRPVVRTRGVALSPTASSWAAATTEGLLLYSLDEGLVFDPTDLAEGVTPQAALQALARGAHLRALLIALRLSDPATLHHIILSTPPSQVAVVAAGIPSAAVPGVLTAVAEYMTDSPHVEYLLTWVRALCTRHGPALQQGGPTVQPALRSLQKVLTRLHSDLATACDDNLYSLRYLTSIAPLQHRNGEQNGVGAVVVAS